MTQDVTSTETEIYEKLIHVEYDRNSRTLTVTLEGLNYTWLAEDVLKRKLSQFEPLPNMFTLVVKQSDTNVVKRFKIYYVPTYGVYIYDLDSGQLIDKTYGNIIEILTRHVSHVLFNIAYEAERELVRQVESKVFQEAMRRPVGFTSLQEILDFLGTDIDMLVTKYPQVVERLEQYVNKYIARSDNRVMFDHVDDHSIIGYIIVWRQVYREMSRKVVIHESLRGKPLVNVDVTVDRDSGVIIVKPSGNYALLCVYGTYHSRGRWCPDYEYTYCTGKVCDIDGVIVLDYVASYSNGGGVGAEYWLIAIDMTRVRQAVPLLYCYKCITSKRSEKYVLYSNGLLIDVDRHRLLQSSLHA